MRAARFALVVLLALSAGGCMRGCTSSRSPIHLNPNMDYQLRVDPQEASEFFYDGRGMRVPVEGTVARGELRTEADEFYSGMDANGAFVASSPLVQTDDTAAQGLRQYTIYCQPCHEKRGTGRGILYEYGKVPMPSFDDERIVNLGDGELFDIITHGKGLMQGYAYPIPPSDRWAIVAHKVAPAYVIAIQKKPAMRQSPRASLLMVKEKASP